MLIRTTLMLTSRTQLNDHVALFTFAVTGEPVQFSPGQYAILHIPYEGTVLRRLYSIASSSKNPQTLEFIIELLPHGKGSAVLRAMEVGDMLVAQIPAGIFTPRATHNPKWGIATGTGIAPFLSMFASSKQSFTFLWGLQKREDIYLEDRLRSFSHVTSTICLSREERETGTYYRGRVTHLLEDYLKEHRFTRALHDIEWYLCGSHHMIADVSQLLLEAGIDKSTIIHEKFTSPTMGELLTHEH